MTPKICVIVATDEDGNQKYVELTQQQAMAYNAGAFPIIQNVGGGQQQYIITDQVINNHIFIFGMLIINDMPTDRRAVLQYGGPIRSQKIPSFDTFLIPLIIVVLMYELLFSLLSNRAVVLTCFVTNNVVKQSLKVHFSYHHAFTQNWIWTITYVRLNKTKTNFDNDYSKYLTRLSLPTFRVI